MASIVELVSRNVVFAASVVFCCLVLTSCGSARPVVAGSGPDSEPVQGIDVRLAECDPSKITPPPEGAIDEFSPFGEYVAGPEGQWTQIDLDSAEVASRTDDGAGYLSAKGLDRAARVRGIHVSSIRASIELADELWIRRGLRSPNLIRAVAFVDGEALFVGMCAQEDTTAFSTIIDAAVADGSLLLDGIETGVSSERAVAVAMADLVSNPGGPTDNLLALGFVDVSPEWSELAPEDRRLDPDEMPSELYEKLVLQTFVFAGADQGSSGVLCMKVQLGWLGECVAASALEESGAYLTTIAVERDGGFVEFTLSLPNEEDDDQSYSVGGVTLPVHSSGAPAVVWVTWQSADAEFEIELLTSAEAIMRGTQPGSLSGDQRADLKGRLERLASNN